MGLEGGEEEWEDEKVEVLKERKSGMEEREKEAEQIGQTKGRRAAGGRWPPRRDPPLRPSEGLRKSSRQPWGGWVGPWEGFPFLSVGQSRGECWIRGRKGWVDGQGTDSTTVIAKRIADMNIERT